LSIWTTTTSSKIWHSQQSKLLIVYPIQDNEEGLPLYRTAAYLQVTMMVGQPGFHEQRLIQISISCLTREYNQEKRLQSFFKAVTSIFFFERDLADG